MTRNETVIKFVLYKKGQMHQNQSACIYFFETIFKMNINTSFSKYTDTCTSNLGDIINHKWSITPF